MLERVLTIVGIDTENEKVKPQDCPEDQILNKEPNRKPRAKRGIVDPQWDAYPTSRI